MVGVIGEFGVFGEEVLLSHYHSHSLFGGKLLVGDLESENLIGVRAKTDGMLVAIHPNYLHHLFSMEKELCVKFYRYLANRLYSKMKRLNFTNEGKEETGKGEKREERFMGASLILPKIDKQQQSEEEMVKELLNIPYKEKIVRKLEQVYYKPSFSYKEGTLFLTSSLLLFSTLTFTFSSPPSSPSSSVSLKLELSNISNFIRLSPSSFLLHFLASISPSSNKSKVSVFKFKCKQVSSIDFLESLLKNKLSHTPSLSPSLKTKPLSSKSLSEEKKKSIGSLKREKEKGEEKGEFDDEHLQPLSPKDWENILSASTKQTFKKGEVLISNGERSKKLFLIGEGECSVLRDGREGMEEIAVIEEGSFFGEGGYLRNDVAIATVVVKTERAIIHILHHKFLSFFFSCRPTLSTKFYRFLAHSLLSRVNSRASDRLLGFSTTSNPVFARNKKNRKRTPSPFQKKLSTSMEINKITRNTISKKTKNVSNFLSSLPQAIANQEFDENIEKQAEKALSGQEN